MMAKLEDRRDEFAEFALAVNGISAWPRGTGEYAPLESCNASSSSFSCKRWANKYT